MIKKSKKMIKNKYKSKRGGRPILEAFPPTCNDLHKTKMLKGWESGEKGDYDKKRFVQCLMHKCIEAETKEQQKSCEYLDKFYSNEHQEIYGKIDYYWKDILHTANNKSIEFIGIPTNLPNIPPPEIVKKIYDIFPKFDTKTDYHQEKDIDLYFKSVISDEIDKQLTEHIKKYDLQLVDEIEIALDSGLILGPIYKDYWNLSKFRDFVKKCESNSSWNRSISKSFKCDGSIGKHWVEPSEDSRKKKMNYLFKVLVDKATPEYNDEGDEITPGDAESQWTLGRLILNGEEGIVEKDRIKAMEWFEAAAEQGHKTAKDDMIRLGSVELSNGWKHKLKYIPEHVSRVHWDLFNPEMASLIEKDDWIFLPRANHYPVRRKVNYL